MSYWGLLKKGGIMATTIRSVNPIWRGKDERGENLKPEMGRGEWKPEKEREEPQMNTDQH